MSEQQAAFRPSPQQEQLWLAQPDGPCGRVQATLSLEGALEADALRAALGAVVDRHEILRTTFAQRPGIRVPFQVIHEELPPAFSTVDLGSMGPQEQRDALVALARKEREASLEPDKGPLLRAAHAALGGGRHALVLTASSLCLDAASLPALVAEIAAQADAGAEVPDEPLQYADYAEWQHELATSEDEAAVAGRARWADAKGIRSPRVPFARESAAEPGAEAEVPYDASLARAVVELAASYGVTPESVVHAAWHALLARLTGAEEVATALLHGGPGRDPLDGLIGPCARPLSVATPVDLDATFVELVVSLDRIRSDAVAWEDYAPAAAPDGLEAGFASSAGFRAAGTDVRVRLEDVRPVLPACLWLVCHDLAGEARVRVAYDPASLDGQRVQRIADRLGRILRSATADPSAATGRLELLPDDERRELLDGFNSSAVAGIPATVQERFERHAQERPQGVAVQDGTRSLSYGELAERTERLARRLVGMGVEPGSVVGLATDRSIDMVVGFLGILRAGAGFLPLNFEHPRARLAHQLREAGCRVLVTQSPLRSRLPGEEIELLMLDHELPPEPGEAELPAIRRDDLAYVIYTSGSTGRPKGVGVTNANLANYVDHLVRSLDAEAEPLNFGNVTALSTDLGHSAIFPALCSGGTLTLVAPDEAADAAALAGRLERTPVDVMKITPSHLAAMLAARDGRVLPRRWLILGGERLGWDLVERIRELGDCIVINHYGPTETTVGSCMLTVPDGPGRWAPASVPIGRPIANTRCYLLDRWRQPVAVGATGALFIAGAGVARGYIGQPELTSERFLADPFVPEGGRMYDTGDLARWLPDGTLEYLGRADEQVKIRGYRVEPGEVEDALRAHPGMREAAVVVRDDGVGNPRLVAYVVHESGVEHADLSAHLAELVPDYMIPALFVSLEALPRTPSGKVDRRSLPEPAEPGSGGEGTAPRTLLEETVAGIWSQVLGVEPIAVEDDFFALGGHSLLAAQVVAQVRTDLAVELPMHSLFTMPTVASLSAEIARLMQSVDEEETDRLLEGIEELSDEEAERMLSEQQPLPIDEG